MRKSQLVSPELPGIYPEPERRGRHPASYLAIGLIVGLLIGALTFSYLAGKAGYELGHAKGLDEGFLRGFDIGVANGTKKGYDEGYAKGVADGAGRGYTLRDPTYSEAIRFVTNNQVDKNRYDAKTYTCVNFAADFKNDAFKAGYKCGYVVIEFPTSGHTIICFNTVDKGIIFIEPQHDEIVTLKVGQYYWDRTKYRPPTFDDTIVRFIIVW